ncbi:hypothetical protein BKA83DRAFT_4495624 [Pisolithus microcarpus]|nr:hypothetical protein BKA83DRAFT_4495624 [Pisolithus microcarpus]
MTMTVSEEQITDQVVARLEGKVLGDLESHLTDRLKESVAVMASEEKIVERVLARLEEKVLDNLKAHLTDQLVATLSPAIQTIIKNSVEVGDGLMGVEGKVYIILGMWVSSKELARKVSDVEGSIAPTFINEGFVKKPKVFISGKGGMGN